MTATTTAAPPGPLGPFAEVPRGILGTLGRDGRRRSSVPAPGSDPDARTLRTPVAGNSARTRDLRRHLRACSPVTRPEPLVNPIP